MTYNLKDVVYELLRCLHDDKLALDGGIEEALERVARLDTGAYDILLRQLVSPPSRISGFVLELILASGECGDTVGEWLIASFPVLPDHFSSSSIVVAVMQRLSKSLLHVHAFERDILAKLMEFRLKVERSPAVIEALLSFVTFKPAASMISNQEADIDNFPYDGLVVKVKQSQRQRKAAKFNAAPIFDTALTKDCLLLGICVPDSEITARAQLYSLFKGLSDILKFYLDTLRDPLVKNSIRQGFLPAPITAIEDDKERAGYADHRAADATEIIAGNQSEVPLVRSMKAALYFDSADGFGEWRILISTRADRDLRDARRRDAKHFRIIVKKIKELSNGHFSDDNQKRLNGPNTEVPIYEAKMERDSRLVYQVDCVPEYDTDIERQVIKIFGVYTHAQIDKRLWDSIGYQLGKKGRQYRQRVIFRNQPSLPGDKVFTPASFPPVEKNEEDDYVTPELPNESLEEMHSLLVLEKFITFSQALLNSIIADLDVAHVFNVSPQEKEIVEYPYSCYVLGRSGTGKTTTMLFKMLGRERAYAMRQDEMAKPRQIFVTQSRVLASKVEEYFSKLLDSLATADKTKEELAQMIKSKKQQQEDEGLVDADDDQNWRADLPAKFSELRDDHFPLFLTFDRLASLLEADISRALPKDSTPEHHADGRSHNLITYDIFLTSYWPRFSQKLKKGLDPALIYSELMGVIQGSEESLSHVHRYLDKAAYEGLSHRTQHTFASRRDIVYAIFSLYMKQKKWSNEYDAADRTHSILNAIQAQGVPGQKIDFLYVDEAQDNLLIDALLLRSIVRNPDGLFWAGDTAQTISVGSSFRFNDLKAFLFRLEKRREDSQVAGGAQLTQEAPRTFQLAINYRSHGGIVECAHSVIELITEFWPYAIDLLSREKGVVDGSKPVFFSGWDSETVRYEQFLFGESGSPIEFGAQQCILVRNEAAREELRRQVGDIGLIMTLYESKGLEFDDVLLYKFFEDSTVDLSQWRIVLNLLGDVSAPRFEDSRHAGVCSELKFLYVAITRARKNLWIVDCSEKSDPMRIFWTSRNEIQNCNPETEVPRLAVSSSPQEWQKSGRNLFGHKRYLQAMHCFERAGLEREAAVAHTYYLREQARGTALTGSKQSIIQRHQAFITAGNAFVKISNLGANPKEKTNYLRNAGACFEEAQEDFKAAEAYNQAQEFTKAAKLYRKCARFDEAVTVVTQNREHVDAEVLENIIDIARLFYFKGGELGKATLLFDSIEEQLEYLEDFDLDVSRAALLESMGRFQEAAEIHLSEGRTFAAIQLFLKDETNATSIHRGQLCIVQGLWEIASFGVKISERAEEAQRLLYLASSVNASTIVDAELSDELTMFRTIKSGDVRALRHLGLKFESQGNLSSAVLCLDHAFKSETNMYTMSSADISAFLHDFLIFCRLLHRVANSPNPCQDHTIRKLFSILSSTENSYLLPNGTFLYETLLASRASLVGTNDQGILVSEWELARRLKERLSIRLLKRIMTENDGCKQARIILPCLPFVINGNCNRKDCPREHVSAASLKPDWLALQVRVHLQQILIVQGLLFVPCLPGERIKQFRHWIGSLFDTLFPPFFRLGHLGNVDISTIPEAQKAFGILKRMCIDIVFWPSHSSREPKLLTTAYQVIRLAFYLDKENAYRAISRSPLNDLFRSIPDYCRKGDPSTVILPELAAALSGTHGQGMLFGMLFVKHVLEKMLPIDANVLFDVIDIISGSIVLNRANLHNITLPLSWLNGLLSILKLDLSIKVPGLIDVARVFIGHLGKLAEKLHKGDPQIAHILFEKTNLLNLAVHRNAYIGRLCRAAGLVGYNINHSLLRSEIFSVMKALKGPGGPRQPHNLYKDYVFARAWSDIARAVQKAVTDTPLDELIQLYHASEITAGRPPLRGIRRVVYKNIADVPLLLDGSISFSNLRPDAPAFVPKPRVSEAAAVEEEADAEQVAEEPEADTTEVTDAAASVESIAVAELPDENRPPSDEQIKAACLFQALYRRRLRRRLKASKDPREVSVKKCFKECLTEFSKMDWPEGSYYRLLFLGPLPHVLACLKAVHSWVMENRQRNKERFKVAAHQDLDEVNKRLTEQRKNIVEIQNLQKALNPQAQVHRKRDIEELKMLVQQVKEMLGRVAPSVARDVEEDMERGIKGIVTVKQAPKKKQKPTLNIDDDGTGYDIDYCDDHDRLESQETSPEQPSKRVKEAACLFQTLYRRLCARRALMASVSADFVRECFRECLAESSAMGWPLQGMYYRLLFLGPLPHVLASLRAAHSLVLEEKMRNKQQFGGDAVKASIRQKELNKTIREIKNLQDTLNPRAPVHKRRDVDELQRLMGQAQVVVGRIDPRVPGNVQEDMERGVKGILVTAPEEEEEESYGRDEDQSSEEDEDEHEEEADVSFESGVQDDSVEYSAGEEGDSDDDHDDGARTDDDADGDEEEEEEEESPDSTRMQSRAWIPVPPVPVSARRKSAIDDEEEEESDSEERERDHDHDQAAASDSGEGNSSDASDEMVGLVMQSLSWVPI